MPIFNIEITNNITFKDFNDNFNDELDNKILETISKQTKIQKCRLTIDKIIETKNIDKEAKEDKISINENNIEFDPIKCYLLIFDHNMITNISYYNENDKSYKQLKHTGLYVENEKTTKFKLNNETNTETNKGYDIIKNIMKIIVVNDILTPFQKNYNSSFEYNKKRINNSIFIIDDKTILTDKFCDELIEYLNSIENSRIENWKPNQNVNCKFINIEEIKDNEIKKRFDDELFKVTGKVIQYLYDNYRLMSRGDSGYCLRKIYGPTRCHKDGVNINPINDGRYLPTKKIRNMSLIMALNDDYEGGEFYFPTQDYKVTLKKGQIIAFPPYWTHEHMVNAPTNGTYRYTINTWLFE